MVKESSNHTLEHLVLPWTNWVNSILFVYVLGIFQENITR